jgi:hypothetical protein
MPLHLVPIPPDCLGKTQAHWYPYVVAIAERAHNHPVDMVQMLDNADVQAFLVWNPEANKAQAFIGVQFLVSTRGKVGQIIWLMGENRAEWVHLFGDLEEYLREHQGCVVVKAIARRGWAKFLKASSYRETHVVMEKAL